MSQNPLSNALSPDVASVAKALASPQCRKLLKEIDRPMTASELARVCDVPRSTAYDKLNLLAESGLLRRHERGSEVRYITDFQEVIVTERDGALAVSIHQPPRSASEQLATLWGEVRSEASED
ncbi:MAG: helix-turn-helix domain-containing protein [Halobellus sp.]|uniref:helix-turn-helix domain-containing protein n=1 Tax=Halobellus sp. TaxID=1979212 RepID=UPI0035D4770F